MDIFSYSRQSSSNYKSPRLHNQGPDHNLRTEENEPKKLYQVSTGTTPTANKLFEAIIKGVGNISKDQSTPVGSTSKVLKSLVNRTQLQDSNRKGEKQNYKTLQINRTRDFEPIILFPENSNGRDYDGDYTGDQGQKLPTISNKKQLPKVDTKRFEKLNGIEKYIPGQTTNGKAGDVDMYATQQSVNNRFNIQNNSISPQKQQQKETWRSPTKLTNDEREYKKGQENGNLISPSVGTRTRYSFGGLKFFQNTLSGGEDEEDNTGTLGFSLMISPVKGSQRVGKHIKKRTEVLSLRQTRAVSPETKDKSVDFAELRKVKMKIEQQNPKVKSHKKKDQNKTSSSVFPTENTRREEKNVEGWDQNESEGSDGKDFEDEEDVEERKIEKKVEIDKTKEKQVYLGLRKGSTQPTVKEAKFEPVVTMVSKQNKRLQDHIQISRIGDKERETAQMKREHAYKEFMLRMNFSFNVQVKIPTEKTFTAYKYFLGKGNNSILIKSLMKQRWWWVQVDNKDAGDVNFMWTQLKQNKFIEGLKQKRKSPFDNLEWSGLSSSQCNNGNDTTATTTSFIDSMTDCESDTTEGETKAPNKKSKNSQASKVSGKMALRREPSESVGKTQEDTLTTTYKKLFTNQEITLMNSMTGGKSPLYPEDCEEIGRLRRGPAPQMVSDPSMMKMCNHLESNYHLANKKALLWNMKSYYEAIKQNVFDYLPLTFHVRNGFEDKEYQRFVEYYNNREKEIQEQEKLAQESKEAKKAAKKLRNIWIVKPGENTNRGVGISVCDSLSQINEIVGTTQGNTDGKKRTYLIQQYLDKPLLYNKRKFDIRCYVLMTCINGMMKGYWYQDGYIRTASKEFSLKNVTNKFIHLTNDAVQKKADEYGKFESGNKLSYTEFQKYLDTHHDGNVNFNTDIYPQIKQLATDAIKGVYGKIDPYRRENSFEIFGLDFMIDTSLRAWLIEVNTNPDINASSPVLTRVIPPMVENALRLTVDQMYPPPAWQTSKKLMLPENLLENNKFELVFDEVEDGPALRNILQADKGATGDLILEIVAEEEEEDAEEEAKD